MKMVDSPLPKATWLMILRIVCNIFSNTTLAATHFTSNLPSSHRAELTQLVITSLLAEDAQVRQTAASLVYNCSTGIASERLQKEQGTFTGMAEQEDDDWQVELSSAILDALSKEQDEEISKCKEMCMCFSQGAHCVFAFFFSPSLTGHYCQILVFGT